MAALKAIYNDDFLATESTRTSFSIKISSEDNAVAMTLIVSAILVPL